MACAIIATWLEGLGKGGWDFTSIQKNEKFIELIQIISGIPKAIADFITNIMSHIPTFEEVVDAIFAVLRLVGISIPPFSSMTFNPDLSLKSITIDTSSIPAAEIDSYTKRIVDGVKHWVNIITSFATWFVELIAKVFTSIQNAISQLQFPPALPWTIDELLAKLLNLIKGKRANIKSEEESAQTASTSGESVMGLIFRGTEWLMNFIKGIVAGLFKVITFIFEGLTNISVNLAQLIKDALESISESASKYFAKTPSLSGGISLICGD